MQPFGTRRSVQGGGPEYRAGGPKAPRVMASVAYLKIEYLGTRKTLVLIPGLTSDNIAELLRVEFCARVLAGATGAREAKPPRNVPNSDARAKTTFDQTSFRAADRVVALHDPDNEQVIPLDVLLAAPGAFVGTYGLVLRSSGAQPLRARGAAFVNRYVNQPLGGGQGSYTEHRLVQVDATLGERIQNLQRDLGTENLSREQLEGILDFSVEEGKVCPDKLRAILLSFLPAFARRRPAVVTRVVNELMDVIDMDRNGFVAPHELAVALSLLWRAGVDDKARLAFDMLDEDNDGLISLSEMEFYLTAFFRLSFHLSGKRIPADFRKYSPELIGRALARHCFAELDINKDSVLSFSEFRRWYSVNLTGSTGTGSTGTGSTGSTQEKTGMRSETRKEQNVEKSGAYDGTIDGKIGDDRRSMERVRGRASQPGRTVRSAEATGLRPMTRRAVPNPAGLYTTTSA